MTEIEQFRRKLGQTSYTLVMFNMYCLYSKPLIMMCMHSIGFKGLAQGAVVRLEPVMW